MQDLQRGVHHEPFSWELGGAVSFPAGSGAETEIFFENHTFLCLKMTATKLFAQNNTAP